LGALGLCDRLLGAHPGWIELLRFDIAKVFEELFPPLAEQPWFVPTTPPWLDFLRIHRVIVVSHDTSEIIEQFGHFLYWYNTVPINSRFRERRRKYADVFVVSCERVSRVEYSFGAPAKQRTGKTCREADGRHKIKAKREIISVGRKGEREQEPRQQQFHLHPWPLHQNAAARPHTYCYHFNRLFLEFLGPCELRASARFTRAE